MEKIILPVVLCVLLSGCFALPKSKFVRVETQVVEVPVALDLPKVVVPPRPALEIAKITPTSSVSELVIAYRVTIVQLQTYASQLESLLNAVNQTPSK
jgi:hypothetical protein